MHLGHFGSFSFSSGLNSTCELSENVTENVTLPDTNGAQEEEEEMSTKEQVITYARDMLTTLL